MSSLAATIVLYGAVVAGVLAWRTLVGRPLGPRTVAAMVLVQVAVTALVVVDAVTTVDDLTGEARVTHLAYLGTALVLLPVAAAVSGPDSGRWTGATLTVALAMLVVVVVRVQQTGSVHA